MIMAVGTYVDKEKKLSLSWIYDPQSRSGDPLVERMRASELIRGIITRGRLPSSPNCLPGSNTSRWVKRGQCPMTAEFFVKPGICQGIARPVTRLKLALEGLEYCPVGGALWPRSFWPDDRYERRVVSYLEMRRAIPGRDDFKTQASPTETLSILGVSPTPPTDLSNLRYFKCTEHRSRRNPAFTVAIRHSRM